MLETNFPELKLVQRGKVRDIYDLGDTLLMVATDRISAFDVVMPEPVPDKGKILNQISLFWFDVMIDMVANHVISGHVGDFPESVSALRQGIRRTQHAGEKKRRHCPLNAWSEVIFQGLAGNRTSSLSMSAV